MTQRSNTELIDNLRPFIAQIVQRQIRRHELDDGSARNRPPDDLDTETEIGNPHWPIVPTGLTQVGVPASPIDTTGFATKAELATEHKVARDALTAAIAGLPGPVDISGLATKTALAAAIAGLPGPVDISGLATKAEVTTLTSTEKADIALLKGLITAIPAPVDISGLATKAELATHTAKSNAHHAKTSTTALKTMIDALRSDLNSLEVLYSAHVLNTTAHHTPPVVPAAGPVVVVSRHLNALVASGADDASETPAGTTILTDGMIRMGSTHIISAFRFENIILPRGATITRAALEIFLNQNTTYTVDIFAEKTGNSLALMKSPRNLSDRIKTTAHQTNSKWAPTGRTDLDINSGSIQEVVDDSGWATGHAITILLYGKAGNSMHIRAYDGAPTNAAKLIIDYT